jgi:hypothetical protein
MVKPIYYSDVCRFAVDAMRDASADELAASAAISGSTTNLARRLFRRHASAERYAARHGLVGVGIVSFAADRLAAFVDRCQRRGVDAPNLYVFANRVEG